MNKKKEISNKLIKTLQIENENLKNKLKNVNSDKSIEVNNLIKEIAAIKAVNNDKEILIEKVSIEKEIIEGKLVELEKEAEDLKQKLEAKDSEREENKSLGEELGLSDPRSQNVSAELCGDRIPKPEDVNNHQLNLKESLAKNIQDWKFKEMELVRKCYSQKMRLTTDLLTLKEKEVFEGKKCKCRGFCRIFHDKHGWRRSFSKEIIGKLCLISSHPCKICDKTFENMNILNKHIGSFHEKKSAYSCKSCDKTFINVDCLKLHVKNDHVEDCSREGEEENKVGVIVKNTSITSGGILL